MGYPGWDTQGQAASWYTNPWGGEPYPYYPQPEQQQPAYAYPQQQYSNPWDYEEDDGLPLLEGWDASLSGAAPQKEKPSLRKSLAIAANIAFFVLIIVMIAGAVAFTYSTNPDKSFFGLRIYNVVSESMTPTVQEDGTIPKGGFRKGDAIIVKKTFPENVKRGDILTVWTDREKIGIPLTHRCVEIIDGMIDDPQLHFITKGDRNKDNDAPIPGSQLIGVKILTLPKLGTVLNFAQEYKALTILLCLGAAALVFAIFVLLSRKSAGKARGPKLPPAIEPYPLPKPQPVLEPVLWPEPAAWPEPIVPMPAYDPGYYQDWRQGYEYTCYQ